MKDLIEIIKTVAQQYQNIKLDIIENNLKLKFYIMNNIYKTLEITQEKSKLKVLIVEDKITKIMKLEELKELILILYKQSNAREYSKEEIELIKQKYVPGTKIELIKMYHYIKPIPPMTRGMVDFVDDLGTIHVIWENGSNLGLVVGTDIFKIICPLCNQEIK